MKTPRYYSRTIAAGAYTQIAGPGRYVTIASISASTIVLSIDGESENQIIAGQKLVQPDSFNLLRFRNSGGVASTIVVIISDEDVNLVEAANAAILAAIAASAASIDADTNRLLGVAAATVIADTVVAATGGAGTLLAAANPARRMIEIQALETNGGLVYIGKDATVSATNKMAVLPAGASWYDEYYTGAVYAVGNDAAESVCGYEI